MYRIDHKSKLEAENNVLLMSFSNQLDHSLKDLQKVVISSVSQQQQHMRSMEEHVSLFLDSKQDVRNYLHDFAINLFSMFTNLLLIYLYSCLPACPDPGI